MGPSVVFGFSWSSERVRAKNIRTVFPEERHIAPSKILEAVKGLPHAPMTEKRVWHVVGPDGGSFCCVKYAPNQASRIEYCPSPGYAASKVFPTAVRSDSSYAHSMEMESLSSGGKKQT